MRAVKFILMLLFTVGLTYMLNNRFAPLPPMGKFLSPFFGFWQNADKIDISYAQDIQLASLSGSVEVQYDDRLIPHIFAENNRDAMLVQGYVTAQHRLWQMEFQTHNAAGRLSELIGERVLERDKETRRMGMVWAAQQSLEEWKKTPEYYDLVEAYAEGVNAYIESLSPKEYPIEYKLLDYAPEKWTPLKTALLLKQMSRTLASKEFDLENTNTLQWLGEETFRDLFPEAFPKQSPIIPSERKWNFKPVKVPDSKPVIPNTDKLSSIFQKMPEGIGSNNWAISGDKSASGHPILCNDPHLPLSMPSIWYEIQIHTPHLNIYGVSLPGSPGVIIGFNEHIAWGVTNVGHDVSDWYLLDWKDGQRGEYKYEGKYLKTKKVIEEFKVRNLGTILDTVYYTHFGSVAYTDENDASNDMAYRWMAHERSNELAAFFNLNKAKNYDDYADAIGVYSCPAQNFVFADRQDIALWVQGKFPLKRKEQGRFLQKADGADSQWAGFIPREHNPHIKNPERGFVSSANQHSTAPDYPYYYSGASFGDYRGRRINQVLAEKEKMTIKDMMALQNDNYSLQAADCLPFLLQYVDKSTLSKEDLEQVELLEDWDYIFDQDKIAPSLFKIWFKKFYTITWDEFYTYARKSGTALSYPDYWRTIDFLENQPEHPFFDIAQTANEKETAREVANASLKAALKAAKDWETDNEKPIKWQSYLNTSIQHLARIPDFSLNGVQTGGDQYAPNANSSWGGPSWRMVVEMGNEIDAYGVYPGGQSGNPGSPYYDNFTKFWATGQYYPLLFMKTPNNEHKRIITTQKMKP